MEQSCPKGAKYIIISTHDVDNIYLLPGLIKYYLKRNPIKSFSLFLGRVKGTKRPFPGLHEPYWKILDY